MIWNNYIDKFQQIMALYDIVDHHNKTNKDTDQSTHFVFYSKFSHNKFIFLVDLFRLLKHFAHYMYKLRSLTSLNSFSCRACISKK